MKREWGSTGEGNKRWMEKMDLSVGSKDMERFDKFLNSLRIISLRFWKRKVRKDFSQWYRLHSSRDEDAESILDAGLKAVKKASHCSFWDWDLGSAKFWRR